ncbi:hypothetical protein Tco_1115153, partial [Tanacetum coccineum]
GKENGVNILKSIDEGPFQMGTFHETLAEGNEGALRLGPKRARVYFDLSPEDKERYNADIRATNILLQRSPKDIYTLINHYTDAKDIWDNVKMLLEGETIHDYYVRFTKLINDMRNIKMTMPKMQLNSKFVNNMLPEWGRFVTVVKLNRGLKESNYDQLYAYFKQHEGRQNRGQGNNPRGAGAAGNGRAQNRVRNANPSQARQIKCYNCNGSHDTAADEDVYESPVQDLALNVDNMFQADECDVFDSDVDEAPTAHTMFMANLSSADPVYDEAISSYDSDILSEMHHDVQPNCVVDSNADYTSDNNMISYDEYVKDNAELVVQSNVSSVPNDAYMMIINEMHEQLAQSVSANKQNKVVNASLTAELTTYKEQVELYERRAKFELTEREQKIKEQLRIVITDRNIKEENE